MARSNKHQPRKVRVRDIPLESIDATKVGYAYWLMAKRLLDEEEQAAAGRERTIE